MSPNAVKMTPSPCDHGQAIVDSAHGEHADGAARTVDQFDVGRKKVLESEAVDGVGVAAAHLHEAIVPAGIGKAPDLLGGFGNHVRFAELIDVSHGKERSFGCGCSLMDRVVGAVAAHLLHGGFGFTEGGEHSQLLVGVLLPDLAHGETHVDQHPVAGADAFGLDQADIHPAAHADHVNQRAVGRVVGQRDNHSRNGEAHVRLQTPACDDRRCRK